MWHCVITVCRGSQCDCKVHLFVDQVDWFDLALNWPEGKGRKRRMERSDRVGASTTGASLQAITERSTHTDHCNMPIILGPLQHSGYDRRLIRPREFSDNGLS